MTEAFEWSFGEGAESAVVLGSDAPTLPATHVDQAFNLLVRSEIVLGPSTDGGYYLIGLSGPHPEVFAGIDWGTDSVFARTLERTAGLTLDLVPLWYDVDTPEDLDLLVTHGTALERSEHAQAALHTRRCHADIHERRSAQADG